MRNHGNQKFTTWCNQNLSPTYRLMLLASGFGKNLKVYEIFPIFYFIHLVTSDDLEPKQVNFDPGIP